MSEIASTTDEIEHLRQLLRDYIVDRERVEDALQESEERYRSLIARAYYGIYRSSVEGRFLEVNAALVRMLGYDTPEELLAVDIRSLYADPTDREKLVRAFEAGEKIPDPLSRAKAKIGG